VVGAGDAEELRAQLAAIVASSDDAILSKTLDGIITSWNHAAERLYGYSAAEAIGRSVALIIPRDQPDELPAIMTRIRRGEKVDHYETVRQHKDGHRIDVSVTVSPIAGADGTIVGASAIARDISEARRLRQALAQSHDQLQAIVQAVADGITVQEPGGQVIFANAAAARLVGYPSPEALIAAGIGEATARFAVFDEAGNPFPLRDLPGLRVLRGEPGGDVLLRFRELAAGEERWAIVRALPARDAAGGLRFAVNAFQDVTQLKRGERSLRYLLEASRLLAASLDYETTLQSLARLVVPELADWCTVHLRDHDGAIRQLAVAHVDPAKVAWAEALAERYPPPADAARGYLSVIRTGASELLSDIPNDLLEAAAPDAEALALLRGLGLSSSLCVPLRTGDTVLGALTFVAAESGRRYTDDDMALAEELARRAAVAIENANLYRTAQEALRVRDAFLGTISHDLRTPLATIRGMVQLALRQARRIENAEGARLSDRLAAAEAASGRMAAMIDEILDLTRLESGRTLDLNRRPTDLVALVERLALDQQRNAPLHTVAVEKSVRTLVGDWDGDRVERVIANLLSNAVKYSPGGGAVSVAVCAPAAGEAPLAEVRVQDQGVGIPARDLPHIFERFHRGANVVGRIRGVGIGLAGAKQIIDQHGGTLAIASVEGEGTTVTVRLPLTPAAAERGQGV
jgi:PAS domain S-box-containing protein